MKLGIGLITYNRIEYLKSCIERIQQFTTIPYSLIVADDGSRDGSPDWCRQNGIAVISGKNRGVVWNKNRVIYALMEYTDVDCIVLLEEDCWPASETWAQQWCEATYYWHHINFAHPHTIVAKGSRVIKSGTGIPSDPYRSTLVTGQCTGCSRHGIDIVGYLDTRFRGYGYGHVEWTWRFLRAGLGKKQLDEKSIYLSITGGLEPHDAPTNFSPQALEHNRRVLQAVSTGSIYRQPWHYESEKSLLISEVSPIQNLHIEHNTHADYYQLKAVIKPYFLMDDKNLMQNSAKIVNIIKLVTSGSHDLVKCALDSPKSGSDVVTGDNLNIKGWVVGQMYRTTSVEVISNGRIIKTIPVDQLRPDVARSFPKYESAKNSGFSSEVSCQDFSIELGLLVQAVLEDSSRIPIYLLKFDAPSSTTQNSTRSHLDDRNVANNRPVPGLQSHQVRSIVLNEYKQIEALLNLHSLIPLAHPLPPLRGWAISPDFAATLYSLMLDRNVKTVVEFGSGSSSLIIGYALQQLGRGKLISLEHDKNYAESSKDLIQNHKLGQYCQIHYAPLEKIEIEGDKYKFYSLDCLKPIDAEFDLVSIDGPPGSTNHMARFPAVPLLYERLSHGAIICLDDANRKDEKLMVKKWLQSYKNLKLVSVPPTEKGMSVLKKN